MGISALGVPASVIETFADNPPPTAVQAVANLLDPLDERREPPKPGPLDIIAAAKRSGVAVMGIRAVQAGALTDSFDRSMHDQPRFSADYLRAGPFRVLARKIGESPASLAHRYSLSMDGVSTVVLGVKSRTELRECVAAEAMGPLDPEFLARIDAAVRSNPT